MSALMAGAGAVMAPPRTPAAPTVDSSAAKVLALLDAFRTSKGVLGVTELAASASVPKSTAHRLLSIMIDSGFVRKVGSRYCLTERSFEIGSRVGSSGLPAVGLRRRAMPYLADMLARTRETVHLGALAGTDVLYLEKLYGHSDAPTPTAVGLRRPAHATALGKAMLAFASDDDRGALFSSPLPQYTERTASTPESLDAALARVREEGVARDRGELRPNLWCIAAPIIDHRTGSAIAAVSVCSTRGTDLERHVAPLRDVARHLERLVVA